MTTSEQRVRVTIEQMGRVLRALEGLKEDILDKNPKLFAIMAEGYLDDVNRMGRELAQYLRQFKRTAKWPRGEHKPSAAKKRARVQLR